MTEPQKLVLKGEPKSTQHVYKIACRGKFPCMYMSQEGKAIKEDYQWQIKAQYHGMPHTGPVGIEVALYFGRKGKHDIDNFNKLLLDACTGIVWIDDSQVERMEIVKRYHKEDPRIEITIIKYTE